LLVIAAFNEKTIAKVVLLIRLFIFVFCGGHERSLRVKEKYSIQFVLFKYVTKEKLVFIL